MITTSGRGSTSLTSANALGVICSISSTFHRVENRGITNTEPATRTPEIVKDDGPRASITARLLLSAPNASAERSVPSESNGDGGDFTLVCFGRGPGKAALAVFGDGPADRNRRTPCDKCRRCRVAAMSNTTEMSNTHPTNNRTSLSEDAGDKRYAPFQLALMMISPMTGMNLSIQKLLLQNLAPYSFRSNHSEMCGIAALLLSTSTPELPPWQFWAGALPENDLAAVCPLSIEDVLVPLSRRGPDRQLHCEVSFSCATTTSSVRLTQTVLSHRGQPPKELMSQSGNVLLFNGEIYNVCEDAASNDMTAVHGLLDSACEGGNGVTSETLSALDELRGPWAIVFWHAERRRLYFGRDILGRRSLMLRVIPGVGVEILSVPPCEKRAGFVEMPPLGLGVLEFSEDGTAAFGAIERSKRSVMPQRVAERSDGELVSGSNKGMYVSFLPSQWLRTGPSEEVRMTLWESAQGFLKCFRRSVQRRLMTKRQSTAVTPRYAVLFSGGIDSLVIAVVLDELLPQGEHVQLINVAFGKDAEAIQKCPDRRNAISGLHELRCISRTGRKFDLCCVDVSPEQADEILDRHVRHLVYPCDQPMDASIGTAIWLAARAKGYAYDNIERLADAEQLHSSSLARILFSGLGADELMGGYKGRHRTIFHAEGVDGIKREMDADLSRLWFRNLGRDDRLIADHGKEVRHPFLDEDLISFVTSLPLVEHVCDLSKPDGVGDKHLLRRAAKMLGVSDEAACKAKRAIQFGSRSKQVIERKRLCVPKGDAARQEEGANAR